MGAILGCFCVKSFYCNWLRWEAGRRPEWQALPFLTNLCDKSFLQNNLQAHWALAGEEGRKIRDNLPHLDFMWRPARRA
jgi:hypothetical protein